MAALQLKETSTGQLILQPSILSRLGSIFFGFIWLVGAGVFVLPMVFGRQIDWVALLFFLLFAGIPVGSAFVNALFTTTITIDRMSRSLSSTKLLIVLPVSVTTIPFSDLENIELQYVAQSEAVNTWMVIAKSRDGKRIRLNWNGQQGEMTELARKVSVLTGVAMAESSFQLPVAVEQILRRFEPDLKQSESEQGNPPVATPTESGSSDANAPASPQNVFGQLLQSITETAAQAEAATPAEAAQRESSALPSQETAPNVLSMDEPSVAVESAMDVSASATASENAWNLPASELERRVATDALDSDARYVLARKYHARGQLDRAMELYRASLRLDPMNAEAQNDLGVALNQRRQREAEAAYRRAIALDPFSFAAHLNLALFLRGLNRAAEASQEFLLARQNARGQEETRLAETASLGGRVDPRLSRTDR